MAVFYQLIQKTPGTLRECFENEENMKKLLDYLTEDYTRILYYTIYEGLGKITPQVQC